VGQQLTAFYDEAKKIGGLKAQMRLAMKTGMAGPQAAAAPDTPDTVSKFRDAMNDIKKEFR
jgi:hypothetical protein